MTDPQDAVQASVIALLTAANYGMTVDIYDDVPPEAASPYVVLARILVEDDSVGDCFDGSTVTVEVHVCDNNADRTRAKAIGRKVVAILNTEVAFEGFETLVFELISADYRSEPESDVMGVIALRYELQVPA